MKKIIAGILAHVDAGKTTLSEMMLYKSGTIRNLGRVDHMDSHMDTDETERARGITIYSSQASLRFGGTEFTLLDTPGHIDFSSEMERCLSVLDYAILVISGAEGVQSHTVTLWRLLCDYKVPVFLFVNKMDISHFSKADLMSDLKARLSPECVDFTPYMTSADSSSLTDFYEACATSDEELLDCFMEHDMIPDGLLQKAVSDRLIFPVLFGSALKNAGVDDLLGLMDRLMIMPDYTDAFSARVYKIARDKNHVRQTFLKITGGSLKVKDLILPYGAYPSDAVKVNEIRLYDSNRYETTSEAFPGTLCAVTGPDASYPGQGYGDMSDAKLPELEPVLSYKVILSKDQNPAVIYGYIKELMDEDPMLMADYSDRLGEITIRLMGRIQLEVLRDKMQKRFNETVDFGVGNIVYKETVSSASVGHGHYEPLKHFADVVLEITPGEPGSGLVITTSCSPDVLEKNYQHQVLNFLSRREHPGILTGFAVTDMHIDLMAGKSHKKHTEGGDFRRAADIALRDALLRNTPVLLEPFYEITLELPQSCIGRAMCDIDAMHGALNPPEINGDMCTLKGTVPVACILDYAAEVASYTGGLGQMTLRMAGYYPCHNPEEVIEKVGYSYLNDLRHPYLSTYVHQDYPDRLPDRVIADLGITPEEPAVSAVSGSATIRTQAQSSHRKGGSDSSGGYQGYGGLEPELEAIFTREFGAIKRYRQEDFISTITPESVRARNIEKARDDYNTSHPASASRRAGASLSHRKKYVLVDGYNVIFASKELSDLAKDNLDAARGALLDKLCNYQGYEGCELIAVFDAYRVKGNPGEYQDYYNIHVVYTREAQTADAYIERATHEIRNKENSQVTVVTSDGIVQMIVLGDGASRMSSREFLELLQSDRSQ